MEFLRAYNPNLRKAVGLMLSGVALSSCSPDNVHIKADIPATVIDKFEESQYTPADETADYSRYKSLYWVVIQQCERDDMMGSDNEGCVVMKTEVGDKAYADYELNELVVFLKDIPGQPIETPSPGPVITSPRYVKP